MSVFIILIGLGFTLGLSTSVWASPLKCQSDKLKAAGKYNFCRLKAASKNPLGGGAAGLLKVRAQVQHQMAEGGAFGRLSHLWRRARG